MYTILFIDEDQSEIEYFQDYIDKTPVDGEVKVLTEYPLGDLEDMISLILKLNPDAIITDFMLNDNKVNIQYNVPYTGADLVKRLVSIRQNFPCFIMTSRDNEAVSQSEDVNIVYIKSILHFSEKGTDIKASFLDKIVSQIKHYKARILNAEEELSKLLSLKQENKATLKDEERIIELDHFLEVSLDKESAVPVECKQISNTSKLEEILLHVDSLLRKIDENGK